MRLTVLGSSGTAPTRGNPASGYLVRTGETTLWVDAGPGTYMALLDHVDPAEVDAVLISHMHPDHSTDLFALAHEFAYVRHHRGSVPVLGPPGMIARIDGFLGGGDDHAAFTVLDVIELASKEERRFTDVTVTAVSANHSVNALAFRIGAGEASLGYTGDTGPSAALVDLFRGVDVLLAEASRQEESEPYPFHMTAAQAGAMAAAADAGSLVLTHIPSSLDGSKSARQAQATFGRAVGLAMPGETYMITPSPQSSQ